MIEIDDDSKKSHLFIVLNESSTQLSLIHLMHLYTGWIQTQVTYYCIKTVINNCIYRLQ